MAITRRAFLASASLLTLAPRVWADVPALPPVQWYAGNPVLTPDQPWEGSFAAPYSGGIWRVDGEWRCYYLAGEKLDRLAVATSADGITWREKRALVTSAVSLDSTSVIRRPSGWVLCAYRGGRLNFSTSEDGYEWPAFWRADWIQAGDRTTFWHDGTSYVWGVRAGAGTASDPRRTDLVTSPTLIPETWEPHRWLSADAADHHGPHSGGSAQLYAVDVVPYEGVFLGLAVIWRGLEPNRPKLNDVTLMVSRDGRDWLRPWREPWLRRSDTPQAWNFGNVQSVGNGVHIVNDTVYVYASGRAGVPGSSANGVVSMGVGMVSKAALDAAIRGVLDAVRQ